MLLGEVGSRPTLHSMDMVLIYAASSFCDVFLLDLLAALLDSSVPVEARDSIGGAEPSTFPPLASFIHDIDSVQALAEPTVPAREVLRCHPLFLLPLDLAYPVSVACAWKLASDILIFGIRLQIRSIDQIWSS